MVDLFLLSQAQMRRIERCFRTGSRGLTIVGL